MGTVTSTCTGCGSAVFSRQKRCFVCGTALEPWERWALQVIRAGGEARTYLPVGPETMVGRSIDNDVCVEEPRVSRRQARLVWTETGARVEECSATNPTRVAGVPIGKTADVLPGVDITVSGATLRVTSR